MDKKDNRFYREPEEKSMFSNPADRAKYVNKQKTWDAGLVINAYLNGEKIQFRHRRDADWTDWHNHSEPVWNFEENNYRVKPVPRELWINVYPEEDGDYLVCHESEEAAINAARQGALRIKLVEVIE